MCRNAISANTLKMFSKGLEELGIMQSSTCAKNIRTYTSVFADSIRTFLCFMLERAVVNSPLWDSAKPNRHFSSTTNSEQVRRYKLLIITYNKGEMTWKLVLALLHRYFWGKSSILVRVVKGSGEAFPRRPRKQIHGHLPKGCLHGK